MKPIVSATSNTERQVLRTVLLVAVVVLPAALIGVAGTWTIGVSASLCVVALLGRSSLMGDSLSSACIVGAAVLGGIIGVWSASVAIVSTSSLPPYDTRVAFGWAALVLAPAATASGVLARTHAVAPAAMMVLAGLLGAVSMTLFSINTYYSAAVVLWLVAAVLALTTTGPSEGAPL